MVNKELGKASLAAAIAAFAIFTVTCAQAATAPPASDDLQEVVVTGTLIPQAKVETSTPVTIITSVEIEQRGFGSVAEALQRGSFSTGAVQGPQFTGGFTPGINSLSLFGLSPQYTKYLIDGRPVADYPALYNGTDVVFNLNAIPVMLIEALDVLPGAQSSIYGSDAIAGVVNIRMKHHFDGPMVDVRYGWDQHGGGSDRRVAIADSFEFGGLTITAGGQYENKNPTWGYSRDLTSRFYDQGVSPSTPSRNYLLYSGSDGSTYYFQDPANCANVAGQYGGTVGKVTRPGHGDYCGTGRTGFFTLDNAEESTQGYLHASYDITEKTQVFVDVLINHDVVRSSNGPYVYNSSFDPNSPLYYYVDNNLGDYVVAQHLFAPEEFGNSNALLSKNTNNEIRSTIGITGDIFGSSWQYAADFTFTENKLTEASRQLFTSKIEAVFDPLFGPQLGFDDDAGSYVYAPDYSNFYKPLTPEQYQSFSGYATSYSHTEESLARVQFTNGKLFPLPGGDAGIAVVGEGGRQGWEYTPDPRYLTGETYGYTATAGAGNRTRYAATTELRLPVVKMVTVNLSGRWDDYKLRDDSVNKATYNIGLEFRPIDQFMLRGRYGTAFKAPTLADQFQGQSGSYVQGTDYTQCAAQGFTAAAGNIQDCGQYNQYNFSTTSGSTKLHPITAQVWDLGAIWSPTHNLSINVDYIHWIIRDEVNTQSSDALLSTEYACNSGTFDPTSPTCVAAYSQITRSASGQILQIDTPKVNVSHEALGVVTAGLDYKFDVGIIGQFDLGGSYTNIISHSEQLYPGDPLINLLTNPYYSSEFKTKGNVTLDWMKGPFGASVLVERYGQTPNYAAQQDPLGYGVENAGIVSPWTLVNASVRYDIVPGLQAQLAVNNLFDRHPPEDHSYPGTNGTYGQPYNIFNYNDYGRQFFVNVTYKMPKH